MIVDAHHHLWDPALADYPWMTDEVAAIRRRFGLGDLEPLLREHGIDGTVLVQARSSLDETRWLLELADAAPFVRGVVGWIDLTDPDAAGVLPSRKLPARSAADQDPPRPCLDAQPDDAEHAPRGSSTLRGASAPGPRSANGRFADAGD